MRSFNICFAITLAGLVTAPTPSFADNFVNAQGSAVEVATPGRPTMRVQAFDEAGQEFRWVTPACPTMGVHVVCAGSTLGNTVFPSPLDAYAAGAGTAEAVVLGAAPSGIFALAGWGSAPPFAAPGEAPDGVIYSPNFPQVTLLLRNANRPHRYHVYLRAH